ncbi:MAG TPA: dTDP-4-amino-4,6-dideoxygalactose transaminase [Bacteroidia bacterium]|nr:dTDP-4-amino-4,6-dideoxygalactose transaminase [Bacteroidia bacterium]
MKKQKNYIPFNKPYISGEEQTYINDVITSGNLSGNGKYTSKCEQLLQKKYGFKKIILTTSCTTALEMSALLMDIKPGDEVIIPSFTFVSTANAFELFGAKIIFADSSEKNPNIDVSKIEALITKKTKAIVVVHYAGIACDMETLMKLVKKHKLFLVEDAANSIDAFYKNKPLGSFGHFATFSFHETKNITSGEGGMLVINDKKFEKRADIIKEKGTNRASFMLGEVEHYSWIDKGSSFMPSEITAAFLFAQINNIDKVQLKRRTLWNTYFKQLEKRQQKKTFFLPEIPVYADHNAHAFYIVCENNKSRTALQNYLKEKNISAPFHYLSLHKSHYFKKKYNGKNLINSDRYTDCLLRLPLFYELNTTEVVYICDCINNFFSSKK